MDQKGQGVPKDYAPAVKWNHKAAEQAYVGGQNHRGFMYTNGLGLPKDYVRGYMWWSLAATQGYENASKSRDMVAKHMTPAQIAEAQKMAREWVDRNPG